MVFENENVICMDKIIDFDLQGKKNAADFVSGLKNSGFQAQHLAEAVEVIERMKKGKATVFFGFTANLVASGLRGVIRDVCKAKLVDVVVTTAGAIDHDIIKSFEPYLRGSFDSDDVELHRKGVNRIGNVFVPTKRYELLEEKTQKWLKEIYAKNKIVSPSELSNFFGSKLNETSFLYWCNKNKIPVFCPGVTDGAIGLQMYFFKEEHKDFVVDVTADMKDLADL
ncbi:MAG: deoxyhypusine synthase family protein, partial [Candidatus Diapherotrites archaeon]|nr:deoxyhypusine synthase family protein [Candidatus Diapherotrites archaeon]